jgi:hypothetical protein
MPLGEVSAERVFEEVLRASGPSFRANAARLATSLRACGGLERALQVIENVGAYAPKDGCGVRVLRDAGGLLSHD